MIAGSTLVRHSHAPFSFRPVGLHGDGPEDHTLEVTKLQLAAADRAQAIDYLIGKQQSDRQADIQKMALDQANAAAERAQYGQIAILEAGTVAQANLSRTLKTTALFGLAMLAALKVVGMFKGKKRGEES